MSTMNISRASAELGMTPHDVLEALISNVADAVYLVDIDGRVVFANPAAYELLGWNEDLLGRISHATIHHHHWDGSEFPQDQCPMLSPRLTGETVRIYGDTFWRRDGSKFRVAYSSAPLATSGGNGAVVVFRDVTAQMAAEDAARRRAVEYGRAEEIHASRARILEAADAERRRLVRNLHDGAQQRLVRILLALRLAGKEAGQDDPELASVLARIADDTDAAISELRDLGAGIRPVILTTRGVRAAVESLTGPFPIPVTIAIPERRFDESIEVGAYFFVAEALTNVIKHAEAESARVHLTEVGGDSVTIEVTDDGRGGALVVAGRGLAGMEDRLAALEGALAIDSPPGGGTRLTATLPVSVTASSPAE